MQRTQRVHEAREGAAMLGVTGVLVAIALVIFLAYRGWSILPASLICASVVALTNGGNLWKALSIDYANGFKFFAGTYFVIFILGSLFGQVIGDSGSASSISYRLLHWFGPQRAVLVVTLATAILTYGGVNLFIVIFTVYPLALILFKAADVPKRLILASVGIGAGTFTMTALPGSPSIQNLIPAQVLGTTPTAAPVMGIVCSAVLLLSGLWYVTREARKAGIRKEHFVAAPGDNIDRLSLQDASQLPDWRTALLPIAVVIAVIFTLKGFLEALYGVSLALVFAILLAFALHWRRLDRPLKSLNDGCANSVMALINTSAIVGFGFVVQNVPAFQSFIQFASGMQFHPLISAAIAVNVIAGITGSASGGLTIFMKAMGTEFSNSGVDPEALHRVCSIASGGLDTLPHSGAVITILMVMGTTHRESYKDLGVVTVVIPLGVTALAVAMGIFLY